MVAHDVFDDDYSYTARRDAQLILDTAEVQRLLAEEGANIAEREALASALKRGEGVEAIIEFNQHPERHAPKHLDFLRSIARQPAEGVPEGSRSRA